MTRPLGTNLVLLGKLACVAVALAVVVGGCGDQRAELANRLADALGGPTSKSDVKIERNDLKGGAARLSFSTTREQTRALIGRPGLGKSWESHEFAELLSFTHLGETIEAFGYEAVTLADFGEAHTGKYAMRATLRRGYTGGPIGFSTEYVVDVSDVRLVAKLVAPPAPPGKRGILPGQVVIRTIREGELPRLDDRYLVELPAKVDAQAWMTPSREDYGFVLSVTKDGAPLPLRWEDHAHHFTTVSAGVHEVRLLPADGLAPKELAPKEPAAYRLSVNWGMSGGRGNLDSGDIPWRDVHVPPEAGADR